MPSRPWRYRIEDILEAIAQIEEYTKDCDLAAFQQNRMLVDAVVRNFQVLGEAARNVPAEIRAKHSEVPWHKMIEMRHFLVHVYFGVSVPIVWKTARNDLPPLVPLLRAVMDASGNPETSG